MSTHSYIGILHKDGSFHASYCHYDGYLAGVGVTLYDHYNSLDKAKELVSRGSFNSLNKDINQIDFDKENNKPEYYMNTLFLPHVDFLYLFDEKENEWHVGNRRTSRKLKDVLAESNLLMHDVNFFKCVTTVFDNDYSLILDKLEKEHESLLLYFLQQSSICLKDEQGNRFVSVFLQDRLYESGFDKFFSYLQQDRGTDYSLIEFDGNNVQVSGDMTFFDIDTVLEHFRVDCPKFRELTEPDGPTM